MISHNSIRTAVASAVVFALITTTISCSGEGDSRQKEQKDLMADVRGGQPVYIRDPQLLSLVRQAVGTGAEFVTDKQMATLQEIIAAPHITLESRVEPKPIRDLEGLEFATALTHLDLSGYHLIDDLALDDWHHCPLFNFDYDRFSPLDTLDIETIYAINRRILHEFDLNVSLLRGLTPLAGLTNLRHLYLRIAPHESDALKPLAGLTNLETLSLSGSSDIDDLTPLASLTNLRHLYLDNSDVDFWWDEDEFAALAGLPNFETLTLSGSDIPDSPPLAGLTNLRHLDLDGTEISDLTPLAGLTNLEYLSLNGNEIDDLAPLAGLTNLKILSLEGIAGRYFETIDLSPLAGLTNLEILNLGNNLNSIEDITPLAGLTNLKILDLSDGALNNLTPLAGLPNLEILNLANAGVFIDHSGSDLTPLAGLTNLRYLDLNGTSFADITPLAGLTNLEWLGLQARYDMLKDITPLAGLTNLVYLDVRSNMIEDITPLAGLTNLVYLDVRSDGIDDLIPLEGLINLRHLYLGGLSGGNRNRSRIDDLAPLARLTNLERLYLYYIKDTVDALPLCALKTTAITGVELDCK